MRTLSAVLVVAAALGFVLAGVTTLMGRPLLGLVEAEGFSRGSTNLALLAIAVTLLSSPPSSGAGAGGG